MKGHGFWNVRSHWERVVAAVGGAEPTLTCNSSAHGDGFAQPQLWFNKPSTDPQRWQFQLCQPAALPEAFQGPQCPPQALLGCSGSAGFHTWAVPRSAKPDIPARKGILPEERTLPGVLRAITGESSRLDMKPHILIYVEICRARRKFQCSLILMLR